jgi:hypothetical protein
MLCGAFNVPWINKPAHISANGRMISHFELYFDLVLVRLHEPPSPLRINHIRLLTLFQRRLVASFTSGA